MPRDTVAFLSYARADGESFATSLRERLEAEQPEITLWHDRANMDGGVDFPSQIRDAIDSVQYLVLVMTPAAMRSEWVRKEWRYARQHGVCVCPVKGGSGPEFTDARNTLPRWISQAHAYDLDKEWERFTNFLKAPCRATRVPFMAPPLPGSFVHRNAVREAVISQVLDGAGNPSARTVVLHGSGGFGKTTVAAEVCHDENVITACDGGILWVTLGEQPSLQSELTRLYAALTGERPAFIDADDAALHLFETLSGKRCLMVIDDVWELEHVRPFLREAAECTRLITTRIGRIAAQTTDAGSRIDVGALSLAEAVRLLSARIGPIPANTEPFIKLANRLGLWPLLVELANGALIEQVALGDTVEGALAWVNEALDKMGVVAFDREDASARNQAIAKTLEVSLSRLKDKRERCVELAVFPEDADVPLAIVGALWKQSSFDTQALAQRLSDLSLIKLNLASRTLRLHDATRAYLASRSQGSAGMHARLAEVWKSPAAVTGEYALRFALYHIVEAMADPAQAYPMGLQALNLLGDAAFREYQNGQGDLAAISRQLSKALDRASASTDPQAPALIAAIPVAMRAYTVTSKPERVFEMARRADLAGALALIDVFDIEDEWKLAARLMAAWIGAADQLAQAQSIVAANAPACHKPELGTLCEWVRVAPSGTPPGLTAVPARDLQLAQVSEILDRAGGAGNVSGIEPLNTGPGNSSDSAFIAETDGPLLVRYAMKDLRLNTQYLRRYISIHAANRYRYYRNRSLWALLRPVLACPDQPDWVSSIVQELITAAMTVTTVDFQERLPLAVRALEASAGNQAAAAELEKYRATVVSRSSTLSPARGHADSWSHYQRRRAVLAEISALGLDSRGDAAECLDVAAQLPKGFAGFRAASCLTLAEAIRVAMPADRKRIDAALLSAHAASHRIQDYPFCLQTTASVNAMRDRWWPVQDLDIAPVIERFTSQPDAAEFCIVHHSGEGYQYRGNGPHTVPIPAEVRSANTLRTIAQAYGRELGAVLSVNPALSPDASLHPGTPVNIPDPDFIPLLAARFAAEALVSPGLDPQRRTTLIQQLVPLAAGDLTVLDTVLSRLLFSAAKVPLKLPAMLTDMPVPSPESEHTASEAVIA